MEKGKRVIRQAPIILVNDRLIVWLVEAAIRYIGNAVSVPTLQSTPVLFPFDFDQPLTYVILNCPALELRTEGLNNQFVAIRGN